MFQIVPRVYDEITSQNAPMPPAPSPTPTPTPKPPIKPIGS